MTVSNPGDQDRWPDEGVFSLEDDNLYIEKLFGSFFGGEPEGGAYEGPGTSGDATPFLKVLILMHKDLRGQLHQLHHMRKEFAELNINLVNLATTISKAQPPNFTPLIASLIGDPKRPKDPSIYLALQDLIYKPPVSTDYSAGITKRLANTEKYWLALQDGKYKDLQRILRTANAKVSTAPKNRDYAVTADGTNEVSILNYVTAQIGVFEGSVQAELDWAKDAGNVDLEPELEEGFFDSIKSRMVERTGMAKPALESLATWVKSRVHELHVNHKGLQILSDAEWRALENAIDATPSALPNANQIDA